MKDKLHETEMNLGSWLSAALEDPNVCKEMKQHIEEWFSYIKNRNIVEIDCPNCTKVQYEAYRQMLLFDNNIDINCQTCGNKGRVKVIIV